ncbi:CBO0543 family protein [Sporomusa aerivorans]|uniref:CBO0543 family protein n=1 Tax=Sporomusa aerivorans TaxID=204936 RepID=UPI00352A8BC1
MDIIGMIHQTRLDLWGYQITEWRMHIFTTRWWFVIALITISYTLWWKFVDKSRLTQILLFGSFIAVFRVIMDDTGASLALWVYSVKPVPLGHALFLNDLTIVPLGFMLVYQYCPTWKKFLFWSIIAETGYSFFLLPLLVHLDILRLYDWQYYYTFFIMIVVVTVMRAILLTVLKVEQHGSMPPQARTILQPAMKHLDLDRENDNSD